MRDTDTGNHIQDRKQRECIEDVGFVLPRQQQKSCDADEQSKIGNEKRIAYGNLFLLEDIFTHQ